AGAFAYAITRVSHSQFTYYGFRAIKQYVNGYRLYTQCGRDSIRKAHDIFVNLLGIVVLNTRAARPKIIWPVKSAKRESATTYNADPNVKLIARQKLLCQEIAVLHLRFGIRRIRMPSLDNFARGTKPTQHKTGSRRWPPPKGHCARTK